MSVPYNDWLTTLTRKADLRERAGLRRSVAPRTPAVDLAGNDYLGLSSHPRVVAAAAAALASFGLGATGSRLVRGTTQLHEDLELALASWIGTEQALVYSSGYLANLGAIRALAALSPQTVLISDAHCHASMVDACRLARVETVIFNHADAAHAASLIPAGRPAVILTESIFSVDGDLAPLLELHAVARSHGALLLVDDAHGLGVDNAVSALAGEPDVVITATLSKALGGAGGVVAGPAPLIRHLVDTSRTFIFDTAPPPAVVAGVLAALDIARAADDLRLELHHRAALLAALPGSTFATQSASSASAAGDGSAGLWLGDGTDGRNGSVAGATDALRAESVAGRAGGSWSGHGGGAEGRNGFVAEATDALRVATGPPGGVVSLRAESAESALGWATACREKGVAVGCFRPPSTPDGRSRLRLTVNVGVPRADFEHALEVIEQCRP